MSVRSDALDLLWKLDRLQLDGDDIVHWEIACAATNLRNTILGVPAQPIRDEELAEVSRWLGTVAERLAAIQSTLLADEPSRPADPIAPDSANPPGGSAILKRYSDAIREAKGEVVR
jgi:hypothetical protein